MCRIAAVITLPTYRFLSEKFQGLYQLSPVRIQDREAFPDFYLLFFCGFLWKEAGFCLDSTLDRSRIPHLILKLKKMSNQIIVTTGIYDAIKDTLRRKKVSIEEEKRLAEELRKAKQVLRRDLPADVVTVERKVTLKDHTLNFEHEYIFVPSTRAKLKKNKHSILSDIALAVVGYKVGDIINWPFKDGERKIEILKVEAWEG